MADSKKLPATAPSLVGRAMYLRPATTEDIANTHHWLLQSEPQALSVEQAVVEPAAAASEAYKKSLGDESGRTFMLIDRGANVPVAIVSFCRLNLQNRSAEISLVVDPDIRRKGHGGTGIRLICRYLFEQRGLNKVYATVAESNHAAVGLLEKAGFKRDGTLRQHFYFDGEYHHGAHYSLMRFEFA
ncbi:GNAT family N-acetyltransferase [candidate division GN15 bacterium]|nr:GNAT family N-acetyltransferase [candidate division GN15 bacterium]